MSTVTIVSLKRVSAKALSEKILAEAEQADPSLAVIDVRDVDYIGGHIKGSTNIPCNQLDALMPTLIRKLKDKKTVVFHCALSQQRGPLAALKYLRERDGLLAALGEAPLEEKQEVFVLERGFTGWQEEYGEDERLTEGFRREIWSHRRYDDTMSPFEWLAAQNEGVVIAVIIVAVIALVLVLPFVVTGTCYYVDRGVRLAFKSCRSLWRNYRAVADQDVVAMEKGEYRPQQAAPVVAPVPTQASVPAYLLTEQTMVSSQQMFMPLEPTAIQEVFVPPETPIIQPLPQVFIPAEARELLGSPRTPPPQPFLSPQSPARGSSKPDLCLSETPRASENRRLLSLTDGSERTPTLATEGNMSLMSTDDDIDLSLEVEVTSFMNEDMSAASSEGGLSRSSEEKLSSPLSDKSGPFIMVEEPSLSLHETTAGSTVKTAYTDEGSPPHTNTTRATTPETELDRNHRMAEKAKAGSWEAPNSRPRTPRLPLRLDRVSEQSNSETD
ncbi:hypothetical protein TgHK011_003220 [Trichoderma gracile]|nr:hypothetical protein TgHK011_003220 [Trichoderma gracile]